MIARVAVMRGWSRSSRVWEQAQIRTTSGGGTWQDGHARNERWPATRDILARTRSAGVARVSSSALSYLRAGAIFAWQPLPSRPARESTVFIFAAAALSSSSARSIFPSFPFLAWQCLSGFLAAAGWPPAAGVGAPCDGHAAWSGQWTARRWSAAFTSIVVTLPRWFICAEAFGPGSGRESLVNLPDGTHWLG